MGKILQKLYWRNFIAVALLEKFDAESLVERKYCKILLEKLYCRIFSGKNTAVVLLEKFYCRIFSGKKLLLKSSCWKICLKIFSGRMFAAES